jgi:hypothetical protein
VTHHDGSQRRPFCSRARCLEQLAHRLEAGGRVGGINPAGEHPIGRLIVQSHLAHD